ncbi:HD-GYP domain-containing protein [Ferviditalea candida]|uniref:HD domain-containing phosphohydrolase n=1 Tax=Ferviditalea candida TaxID=3108399 RepID=A0ABU5ZNW2_9BACL|nr:HD domain-containing phosphohydrolase [Paenibacillaceae bacterium T2]
MRFISISEYDEHTMQLAKPVYDAKRRILLAAGSTIHPKYRERLIDIGISHLIVEDAVSRGITMEELLDAPTWLDVIDCLQMAYVAAGTDRIFPAKDLLAAAGMLLKESSQRTVIVALPSSTVAAEMQAYAHSVNVAIMALQTGKRLGYNQLQLRDLVVGCLLHDIGKAKDNRSESHPESGFQIVRGIREISLLSAHVAYQHHETLDGNGHPRQMGGKEIHEYAQVCAVANRYDHLTTDERMQPHEAMETIMAQSGIKYAENVVSAFVRSVPAYPPGARVRLLDGNEAIVTRIVHHLQRPCIRIMETGEELSLADHPSIMIQSK